jgi:hypothetical protein
MLWSYKSSLTTLQSYFCKWLVRACDSVAAKHLSKLSNQKTKHVFWNLLWNFASPHEAEVVQG